MAAQSAFDWLGVGPTTDGAASRTASPQSNMGHLFIFFQSIDVPVWL